MYTSASRRSIPRFAAKPNGVCPYDDPEVECFRNSPRALWTRPLLFAWGFFCVALLPVLGFADVGFMKHSLVADHYEHIALIGTAALAGAAWSWWYKAAHGLIRAAAIVAAAVAVVVLATATSKQSRLYADPIALYAATLRENPESSMAHLQFGRRLDG